MAAEKRTINLLPLDDVDRSVLNHLAAVLKSTFSFDVSPVAVSDFPVTIPSPVYGERYHSAQVLNSLARCIRRKTRKLLAVTNRDLYSPVFAAYFGEALLAGSSALISLCRLRQEYYDLTPQQVLFLSRCEKVAIHEVAHTFGVVHCHDNNCVMFSAPNIVALDARSACFCPDCSLALNNKLSLLNR